MSGGARPGFHFTSPRGHVNDPLGVTWHDTAEGGRYELFYQLNPDAPAWVPECRWGQADGPDLVRWQHPRTALEPAAEGEGCWSGAVAVDPAGTPTIVYTSVDAAAPDVGRIALARATEGWDGWTIDPGDPVVPGPPPELGLAHYRDPFVWADADGGWRMVVGGGDRAGLASLLAYSSPDLRTWRYDGVAASRSTAGTDPLWTGSLWECPQLFPLDDAWVLVVSVWDGDPVRVAAAVGDWDGARFTARSWQHLDATGELYATTAFADAAGRRCLLSWVPGPGPAGSPWAGMLSLPHLVELDGDRLRLRPHPDVDTLRSGPAPDGPVEPLLDVRLTARLPDGGRLALTVREDAGEVLSVVLTGGPEGGEARLLRPGRDDGVLPVAAGNADLRLLLDAGIAEVVTGEGRLAVLRLPAATGAPVRLSLETAGGAGVQAYDAATMTRCSPPD